MYLRIESGTGAGTIVPVRDGMTFGREADNTVHLVDEAASRHHCQIRVARGKARIEDLGSRNGVLVNGHPVEKAELAGGDTLRIGSTSFTFLGDELMKADTAVIVAEGMEVVSHCGDESDPLKPDEGEGEEELIGRLGEALEAARRVGASAADLESFAEELLGYLEDRMRATRTCLLLGNQGEERTYARDPSTSADLPRAIIASVREHRRSVLLKAASEEPDRASPSIVSQGIESALAVPIAAGGEVLGLVYLDRTERGRPFTRHDLRRLDGICRHLAPSLRGVLRASVASERVRRLEEQLAGRDRMIGSSRAFVEVLDLVERVAATDTPVLVTGETGTGKELIARAIHDNGDRESLPFVAVNCAGIPRDLIESEFFGHVKGAFTGATRSAPGKFKAAGRGTIFLDEVGEIPLGLQSKLLRALEQHEYYPVGSTELEPIECRVIAATNRDLAAMVASGQMREDLYYRLDVVSIAIPSLRRRPGDVAPLARYFLENAATRLGRVVPELTPAVIEKLEKHAWPGNVRELKNAMERAVVLARGKKVNAGDLGLASAPAPPGGDLISLKEAERRAIARALESTGWKKGEALKILEISWPTLNKKIEEYGIGRTKDSRGTD